MRNIILVLIASTILSVYPFSVTANPYSEPSNRIEETNCMWFDSLNVRFVGNWPFGASWAVATDSLRDLLFCGSGGGVYVTEVSNPSNPVKISEDIQSRDFVWSLYYDHSTQNLFVTCGFVGMQIWDISIPNSPLRLTQWATRGEARDIFVSDSLAYIAARDNGLRIIDVSDPLDPYEVGWCLISGNANAIFVSGSYAYVGASNGSLRVIDVSDPHNPHCFRSYTNYNV